MAKYLWQLDNALERIIRPILTSYKPSNKYFNTYNTELKQSHFATFNDATDLLFIVRYLERIGDITCKVGSKILFMVEGKRVWIK